ncbi:M81 family metallopeptidase [Aquincola sp. S2]|uniref:Microcystinase C n=1 Tax=Pseudaquabacterium terrae TaxID=2732868 RepID=A0ABX2EIG8_9BURK|nr:M81 family metallopeptidase [Aquabacterium terrae]NRF68408.1 M81 family metallopeptidase [Aquabacterium terrae]
MTRIFIAGFQHETNTFAPSKADWAAFNRGSSYPAFARGDAMVDLIAPGSLPLAGFITTARERGWTLLPSVWAGATPSAQVTEDAFERIAGPLLEDLRAAAGTIDGIFLDLHGAAVAEHLDDAEGELLERIRGVVGPQLPIVATLDLHANVSERMLRQANAFAVYRTYPHIDMHECARRAAETLAQLLAPDAPTLHTRSQRLPFLLPLNTQCTLLEPAAGLMRLLPALEAEHGVQLEFAMGFPAADIADCGPVVFGHGSDAQAVQRGVRALADAVSARRADFALQLLGPREAVREALQRAEAAIAPVVIADTQDNPGAGGDSNTTGMLHALLAERSGQRHPGRIALGLLVDPEAAAAAHAAGAGARLTLSLGRSVAGYDGRPTDDPLTREVIVRALSDGTIALHGPMTAGNTVRLGPCARIEVDGVQVLLSSAKCQLLDLDLCRFLGIEPAEMALIVVKSSVHFRAAFAPIAASILVAKAPGPMAADPADLPWTKLPPSTARRP